MSHSIKNCTPNFSFQCPTTWDQLIATDTKNIRFCNQCQHNVYFCTTLDEVTKHAKEKHCVAIEAESDNDDTVQTIGEVDITFIGSTPHE